MKKIWLLIIVLLMYGCGGGGGGTAEVQPPSDSTTGKVVVKIIDKDQKAGVDTSLQLPVPPTATKLRLVISNPNIKINNAPYKKIIDGLMVSSLSLEFPIGNGYVFELLTYYPDTVNPVAATPVHVNRMLKYAKDIVDITKSGADVTLVLQPITATFTISDPVISGDVLNPVTSIQSPPLQAAWKLFQSTTDINNALHSTSAIVANHSTDKAPIVSDSGKLCSQGEFFISNTYLDIVGSLTILDTTLTPVDHKAEHFFDWTLNYPNPEFGDASYCVTLNLVPVTVPVNP